MPVTAIQTPAFLSARIMELACKVLGGTDLSREEAREVAAVDPMSDEFFDLLFWANKIRIARHGRSVHFCSIVTGKVGGCSEDCSYCSQSSAHKTHVKPAVMSVAEMEKAGHEALASGASSFGIVNSGWGPTDKELDWMEPFFKKTAEEGKVRPCATLGHLSPEHAKRLRGMGVERVNHNLEASERHFPSICSTHTYADRVNTIRNAKAAGLSICSGGIFGMGENWEDRIDMALALRDLDVDVVPINFLFSIDGTRIHGTVTQLEPREALQIIAVYRFLLPTKELKIAGGREKVLRDMQSWIFFAGGSSFLIGNYLTTFGRTPKQDHQMLKDLGVSFHLYNEMEVRADPDAVPGAGPGAEGVAGAEATYMQRKSGGRVVALEVAQPALSGGGGCCGK